MRHAVAIALLVLFSSRAGLSCVALSSTPKGKIAIASESAVIVWNERTHTERFIRSADFRTDQESIGFLVPTPTPPSLAPASGAAFSLLEDTIRPKVIVHHIPVYVPVPYFWLFLGGTAENPYHSHSTGSVDVLAEGNVGDYDTAILRADDTGALSRWLTVHGYVSRPAVQEWLRPYIRKHWTITAFKVDRSDPETRSLILNPVCMSFHTDRPFYPYSEPADARVATANAPGRLLRLFVLSDRRMSGALEGNPLPWPGKTVWANARDASTIPDDDRLPPLSDSLGVAQSDLDACFWLTAFEDRSSPRPGIADLVFTPDSTGESVTPRAENRNEIVYIHFPLEPLLLGLWMVSWIIRKRREILSRPVDRSVTLFP